MPMLSRDFTAGTAVAGKVLIHQHGVERAWHGRISHDGQISMMRTIRLAATTALLGGAFAAHAALLNYSEVTDGDLPVAASSVTFVADAGTNTVSGNMSISDYDSFSLFVPTGLSLLSAHLEWGASTINTIGYQLSGPGMPGSFDVNPAGTYDLTAGPYGPGTFALQQFFVITSGNADYVFTFEVAAASVPEPGSFALAGLALAGIAAARRRHSRRLD